MIDFTKTEVVLASMNASVTLVAHTMDTIYLSFCKPFVILQYIAILCPAWSDNSNLYNLIPEYK